MLPQPQSEDWFGLCPLSLAATYGIDVSFFSSRYLDVSVPWVRFLIPMYSGKRSFLLTIVSPKPQTPQDRSRKANSLKITIVGSGFPHSDISGSKLVRSSPELFAAYHVLHRLSAPRHPPNALKTLDRSHCRYSPNIGKANI